MKTFFMSPKEIEELNAHIQEKKFREKLHEKQRKFQEFDEEDEASEFKPRRLKMDCTFHINGRGCWHITTEPIWTYGREDLEGLKMHSFAWEWAY